MKIATKARPAGVSSRALRVSNDDRAAPASSLADLRRAGLVQRAAIAAFVVVLAVPIALHLDLPGRLLEVSTAITGLAFVAPGGDLHSSVTSTTTPVRGSNPSLTEIAIIWCALAGVILSYSQVTGRIERGHYDRRTLAMLTSEPIDSSEFYSSASRFTEISDINAMVNETIASLTRLEAAGWARAEARISSDRRLIWIWVVTHNGKTEFGRHGR